MNSHSLYLLSAGPWRRVTVLSRHRFPPFLPASFEEKNRRSPKLPRLEWFLKYQRNKATVRAKGKTCLKRGGRVYLGREGLIIREGSKSYSGSIHFLLAFCQQSQSTWNHSWSLCSADESFLLAVNQILALTLAGTAWLTMRPRKERPSSLSESRDLSSLRDFWHKSWGWGGADFWRTHEKTF